MRIAVSALIYLALAHGALAQDDMDGQIAAALDEIFGTHGTYETAVLDPDTGTLHIENAILAGEQGEHVSIGEIVFADPIITDGHLTHFSSLTLTNFDLSHAELDAALSFDLLTITGADNSPLEREHALLLATRVDWQYMVPGRVTPSSIAHLHVENFNWRIAQSDIHMDALTLDGLVLGPPGDVYSPRMEAPFPGSSNIISLDHMHITGARYAQNIQSYRNNLTIGVATYSIGEVTFTNYQNGKLAVLDLFDYDRDISFIEGVNSDENRHIETLTFTRLIPANIPRLTSMGIMDTGWPATSLIPFDALKITGYTYSSSEYDLSLDYGYLTGLIEQPDGTSQITGNASGSFLTIADLYGFAEYFMSQPYAAFFTTEINADMHLDLRYDPAAETVSIDTAMTTDLVGDLHWAAEITSVTRAHLLQPLGFILGGGLSPPHLPHLEISYTDNGFLDILLPFIAMDMGMSRDALIDELAASQDLTDPDRYAPIAEEVAGFLRQGGTLTVTLASNGPISVGGLFDPMSGAGTTVTATHLLPE